ncbi:MAG: tRNA guanosine(34) transglycosylase Tgt [Armatimonadetes bacterium JP3_11]|nr:MAG: tRNA guanosine(34) transglycosylase Tgt [Armatimonadetes bacterium CP1_7O]OYT75647.1 MAG: tRNA guanosine(34) transglycosylase Tgt [Armatimonadetes bacterium JP3_11]RMH08577.1 MAG: tRNA guanosine(34) transglycosylase Tgt [Armatimonadota bacterium]
MIRFETVARSTRSHARVGKLHTPHGVIETPVFMPVGTQASVKTLSQDELEQLGFKIILGNTYHLYLRPGDERIARLGGLHRFMSWSGAILTDSGGFQVFSLAGLRQIDDEGVTFRSHLDGSEHRFTPERSIQVQRHLGSDIMMAFDECPPYPASYDAVARATERTYQWAIRSKQAWESTSSLSTNGEGALFGIIQGGVHEDLRLMSLQQITSLELPGYAIGGVSVGEPVEEIRRIVEFVAPRMPAEKPRYLMGVGTPEDILHAVQQGVDMFDCVLPTRMARHGAVFTSRGRLNLRNAKHLEAREPIDPECRCWVCQRYTLAYIHHLFRAGELLGLRLATYHNLAYYARWMAHLREAIKTGAL